MGDKSDMKASTRDSVAMKDVDTFEWIKDTVREYEIGKLPRDRCVQWPFQAKNNVPIFILYEKPVHAPTYILRMSRKEEPPKFQEALRTCGNKKCMNPHHMEWGTPPFDELPEKRRLPGHKLSAEEVTAIWEELRRGTLYRDIMMKYNVSKAMIGHIRARRRHAHVTAQLEPLPEFTAEELKHRCSASGSSQISPEMKGELERWIKAGMTCAQTTARFKVSRQTYYHTKRKMREKGEL